MEKNMDKNNKNDKKPETPITNPAKKNDKVEFANEFDIDADRKTNKK